MQKFVTRRAPRTTERTSRTSRPSVECLMELLVEELLGLYVSKLAGHGLFLGPPMPQSIAGRAGVPAHRGVGDDGQPH
jgi:hypothetical protein